MDTRTRPRELTVTVKSRVVETPDTVTLVFEPIPDAPPYKAGQFLTIAPKQFDALRGWATYLEAAKGGRKELPRAYSMCSAPQEANIAITIKEEPFVSGQTPYPPLLSPFLTYAAGPGLQMQVVGFTGPYVLPPDIEQRTDHLVHLVAGSGSVPNFSILKSSLREHPRLRHTFVYSNKTWQDIAFREPLAELEQAHPTRIRVLHTLTREPDPARLGETVRAGRITLPLLEELVAEPTRAFFYVCGPAISNWERRAALEADTTPAPRFLETMLDYLERLGIPKVHIKREAYG